MSNSLKPNVSVVIPFVNHQSSLERAVESVLKQTYSSWEILLIDNNSSDGTTNLAQHLATSYEGRIRYIHEERQGIPFARNKGLCEAKGKYVAFLDADDEFFSSKLYDQINILENNMDIAMVYGLTKRIYVPSGKVLLQNSGIAKSGITPPPFLAIDWISCFYHLPQTGSTLTRTAIARDIGGFEENLLLGNDDISYHLKLAFHYCVWFIPQIAVIYYRHEQSEGSRLNKEKTVKARYVEAFSSWIVPYCRQFKSTTGDGRPLYWAEEGLANNLVSMAHEQEQVHGVNRRKTISELVMKERKEGVLRGNHYSIIFFLHKWLPLRSAKLGVRVLRRLLYILVPQTFPLDIPRLDEHKS